MKKKLAFYMVLFIGVITLATILIMTGAFVFDKSFSVLHPQGMIAVKQRDLLLTSTLLMLIVVIPVFIITFYVAWKYRESHPNTKYTPNLRDSVVAEFIWWGVPCIIVIFLSVLTWNRTHELDPYRPIASSHPVMKIQVVALQWKWLFIYPEYNIASVNYVRFPEKTPIHFEITADAPMNSFWIPSLGGQIAAMPGMRTSLHLIADEEGEFRGVSANISGRGFAGMQFQTHASSQDVFDEWIKNMQASPRILGLDQYKELAMPSENHSVSFYTLSEPQLFDRIIMKYMMP